MRMLSDRSRLLLLLGCVVTVALLATTIASYVVSRDSIRHGIVDQALPLTADNIYSEIQKDLLRPVFISSLMANDTFVRDWILGGERDADRAVRYLNEVKQKYGTVTSFLVSERSRKYYHAGGILKTVKESVPIDKWFFRVRAMDAPYETNIDPDMANRNTMTIFINYRVLDYHGNFIGATGVGLTLDTVNQLIDRYQEQFRRRIYFVDAEGTIVLAGKSMTSIRGSIRDLPGLDKIADGILHKGSTYGNFEYTLDQASILLNSRYIPELGWFLIVEQDEREETQAIRRIFFANLAIAAVAILLVFAILVPAVNRDRSRIETMAHEAMQRAAYETQRADEQQQFVAMVSHEFRTPLAIIDASLQSLKLFQLDLPPEIGARHQKMQRASWRLQELITNYLTGDRLRQEQPATRMEPIALHELLQQVVLRSDSPHVALEHVDETLAITGDAELLRIAFANLVSNAIKYSADGSPIAIHATSTDPAWIEIAVVDHGVGIAAADLPKIFDKYFRAAGSGVNGAGLGLHLVKRIVELHGGTVAAESAPGQGTTMRVRLPRAA